MRRILFILLAVVALSVYAFASSMGPRPGVTQRRVPDGGIQPQVAVDEHGTVHLVYFHGDAANGNVWYVRSTDGGSTFSTPIQVNHIAGSAIATGTVRGAQLALGRNGRVHVAWNGSPAAAPTGSGVPMLYTRLDDAGTAFEPERNVMHAVYDIDGGGAVAADRAGHVYVVWHANAPGERGEDKRRVWVARSTDDGRTFEHEQAAFDEPTGACGCCGLGTFADIRGTVYILFRSAFETVNRDMYLLTSHDLGRHFDGTAIDRWNVGLCVMSTQAFSESKSGVFTAWETKGQVYRGRVDPNSGKVSQVMAAPGADRSRKHPALAVNARGDVLLAWTEGTAWSRGGSAAWQLFDNEGNPKGEVGHADGVPVWGLVAAYPRPDGGFTVVY